MIKKEDVSITGYNPAYDVFQSVGDDFEERIVLFVDIDFILFSSIVCTCTLYKDLKTEDEIHNEIVRYINSKITKD